MLDRRADHGSTHVLEAVIVATIMVSAVAFVATFNTAPTTNAGPARATLQQRAQDALAILSDTPVKGNHNGTNKLSIDLAECMKHACGNLSTELKGLLPAGTSYAVYVSNGYQTYPVLVTKQPEGEAITASQLVMPSWSHSFVDTGMTNVNPQSDSLLAYTLPVFNSNVLSQGGSPLRVLVAGERLADHSNFSVTGFFTTQQFAVTDGQPAVSLTFQDLDTKAPTGYIDAFAHYGWTNNAPPPAVQPSKVATLKLNVTNNATIPLPLGAEVTVNLPRGWTATMQGVSNPDFDFVQDATDASGAYGKSDLVARLNKNLVGPQGTSVLTIQASYHGDELDYYAFHATLAKGALAEANAIARADSHPSLTVEEVPSVQMSVPRPMGAMEGSDWTLTVDIPAKNDNKYNVVAGSIAAQANSQVGDERINIHTITVLEQDGKNIFGPVWDGPTNGVGFWKSAGDRLFWVGNYTIGSQGSLTSVPFHATFHLEGNGVKSAGGAKNSFAPPFNLSTWTGRGLSQVAPGFYRQGILPADSSYGYPGYDPTLNADGFGSATPFESNSVYRATLLAGRSAYTANPITSLHDSVYGSYVMTDKRVVPVGGSVQLTADVQSMLFALSEAGVDAGVNVTIYPPWAGDEHQSIWNAQGLDQGILASNPTQVVMLDLNGDGFPDPIVGTSNGRVLGYNGLTGGRLEGKSFNAPVLSGQTSAASSVQQLSLMQVHGATYIVVGTDKNSGLYVLDTSFNPVWSDVDGPKLGMDTLKLDTAHDVTGDGVADIVAAYSNSQTSSNPTTKLVAYTTPALPGQGNPPNALVPLDPTTAIPGSPHVLAQVEGTTQVVSGFPRIGFNGTASDEGLVAGFSLTGSVSGVPPPDQTLNGAGNPTALTTGYVWVYNDGIIMDPNDPVGWVPGDHVSQGLDTFSFTTINGSIPSPITPRAGLKGFDIHGNPAWTVYGSPITAASEYSYNPTIDSVPDFVVGSSAGYVTMQNGSAPASPLHAAGGMGASSKARIDSWAHDSRTAASLFLDGKVTITHDGFAYDDCTDCWVNPGGAFQSIPGKPHPGALSIAMNDSLGVWIVGTANAMWHTTPVQDSGYAQQPYFVSVAPNVTRGAGEALKLGSGAGTTSVDFRSVAFHWGAERDQGWVVGGPINATTPNPPNPGTDYYGEPFVMRTTNGGATWTQLDFDDGTLKGYAQQGDPNHQHPQRLTGQTLLRINFTDDQHAFIVGDHGLVLRSMDGGVTFSQVHVPGYESATFRDVACEPWSPSQLNNLPQVCLLIGEHGVVLRTENAWVPDPGEPSWTPANLPPTTSWDCYSGALANDNSAVLGCADAVLRSYDRGQSWAPLPMGYVQGNGYRSFLTPDGLGFVVGGNATLDRIFFLQDYAPYAQVVTAPLANGAVRTNSPISHVHVDVDSSSFDSTGKNPGFTNTKLGVYASTDDGHTWTSLPTDNDGHPGYDIGQREADAPGRSGVFTTYSNYTYGFSGNVPAGSALRVRVDLVGAADWMQQADHVLRLTSHVTYADNGAATDLVWNMMSKDSFDWSTGATTAVWEPDGVLHAKPTRPFWNQNVSGMVEDIQLGSDATNPGYPDVWIATGPVFAANSPDYVTYGKRDPNAMMSIDGRIYRLDGQTGRIAQQSAFLGGSVTHLRVVKDTHGAVTDVLATVEAAANPPTDTNSHTYVVNLNPADLSVRWSKQFDNVAPLDLENGTLSNGQADAVTAFKMTTATGATTSGFLTALEADNSAVAWQAVPDQLGLYTLNVNIPDNWLFGPYVVETSVTWVEQVSGGNAQQTKAVVQTARLFDYFMVAPPSLVNPPSPVYDVKLVAWYDDWR